MDIVDVSTGGGIAIWDMQLSGNGFWQNPVTWDLIALFKDGKSSAQIHALVEACSPATSVSKKEIESPVFYDSYNKVVNLSGKEGELYLYSSLGIIEKSWKVNPGENVSLEGTGDGFHILKFETSSGLYSQGICVFK